MRRHPGACDQRSPQRERSSAPAEVIQGVSLAPGHFLVAASWRESLNIVRHRDQINLWFEFVAEPRDRESERARETCLSKHEHRMSTQSVRWRHWSPVKRLLEVFSSHCLLVEISTAPVSGGDSCLLRAAKSVAHCLPTGEPSPRIKRIPLAHSRIKRAARSCIFRLRNAAQARLVWLQRGPRALQIDSVA